MGSNACTLPIYILRKSIFITTKRINSLATVSRKHEPRVVTVLITALVLKLLKMSTKINDIVTFMMLDNLS